MNSLSLVYVWADGAVEVVRSSRDNITDIGSGRGKPVMVGYVAGVHSEDHEKVRAKMLQESLVYGGVIVGVDDVSDMREELYMALAGDGGELVEQVVVASDNMSMLLD